jgi:hypothetical protein
MDELPIIIILGSIKIRIDHLNKYLCKVKLVIPYYESLVDGITFLVNSYFGGFRNFFITNEFKFDNTFPVCGKGFFFGVT